MRAKLLMLTADEAGEALALSVQDVLSELAVAFGHSFVIKEERIGKSSLERYGAALTQEVLTAARECDACICLGGTHEEHATLAVGLGCALGSTVVRVPEALGALSRLKEASPLNAVFAFPLKTDEDALRLAAKTAYHWAKTRQLDVREIPFSGSLREAWDAATGAEAAAFSQTTERMTALPAMLEKLVVVPQEVGMVFGTPTAWEELRVLALALSGLPASVVYDCYLTNRPVLFVSELANQQADSVSPFGVLTACADMLAGTLGLTREADCLLTSVQNVLDAGWRTADIAEQGKPRIGADAVCRLVSEQIALAGQLMIK